MVDIEVEARSPVQPTEDPNKVATAVRNLFPDADLEIGASEVRATATDLARLRELIANHRIPDSARMVMLRGRDEASPQATRFVLGKQAAFAGRPNFAPPPSPLGDIAVVVRAASPAALEQAVFETAPDTTVAAEFATVPPSERPPEPDEDMSP